MCYSLKKRYFPLLFASVKGREISVESLCWRRNFAKENLPKLQCDYVQQFQQYNMWCCSSKLTFYLHVADLTHKCLSDTISFATVGLSSSLISSDGVSTLRKMVPVSFCNCAKTRVARAHGLLCWGRD